MKLITQNFQTKKLIETITKEAADIKLAVAFWGQGSSEMIKKIKNKKVQFICNLESGATNPYELIKIGKLIGFKKIRSIKNLHAKVYLTNNKMILGSSNFSSNGLSLEGDDANKLIEANLLIEDSNIIKAAHHWFNSLWKSAKKVDVNYCEKHIPKWVSNRKRNPVRKIETNFFKAYENGEYLNEKIYIIVDTIDLTLNEIKIGNKAVAEVKKGDLYYRGKEISYWYDYPNVPRDSVIISYFYEKKGRLYHTKIWKTLAKKYDKKGYQFCFKMSEKTILKNHIDQITAILKQNAEKLHLSDIGLEIKLSSFYEKFRPKEQLITK